MAKCGAWRVSKDVSRPLGQVTNVTAFVTDGHSNKAWVIEQVIGDGGVVAQANAEKRARERAQLIAAAPELLEACKNLLANPTYESRIEAVKAIAKAEGK